MVAPHQSGSNTNGGPARWASAGRQVHSIAAQKERRFGRSMIRSLEDFLNYLSIGEERQVIP